MDTTSEKQSEGAATVVGQRGNDDCDGGAIPASHTSGPAVNRQPQVDASSSSLGSSAPSSGAPSKNHGVDGPRVPPPWNSASRPAAESVHFSPGTTSDASSARANTDNTTPESSSTSSAEGEREEISDDRFDLDVGRRQESCLSLGFAEVFADTKFQPLLNGARGQRVGPNAVGVEFEAGFRAGVLQAGMASENMCSLLTITTQLSEKQLVMEWDQEGASLNDSSQESERRQSSCSSFPVSELPSWEMENQNEEDRNSAAKAPPESKKRGGGQDRSKPPISLCLVEIDEEGDRRITERRSQPQANIDHITADASAGSAHGGEGGARSQITDEMSTIYSRKWDPAQVVSCTRAEDTLRHAQEGFNGMSLEGSSSSAGSPIRNDPDTYSQLHLRGMNGSTGDLHALIYDRNARTLKESRTEEEANARGGTEDDAARCSRKNQRCVQGTLAGLIMMSAVILVIFLMVVLRGS